MTERITVAISDHVATVALNRPDKHNAVDHDMFEAIIRVGSDLASDRSLRAVILHGVGDNFCAGIDVSVFAGGGVDPGSLEPRDDSPANYYQSAAYVWREMPVPVIAALHGAVFGAGLQIALGADLRYARRDARLSVMEIKWGIIPDMGISVTMPPLMAYDKAAELAWTGRTFSGGDAAELGLVTATVDDPLSAAQELARRIAEQSPDAIRATKSLFRESWSKDRDAALLRREAELQLGVLAAPNQREAVLANQEKRAPVFTDTAV
jgi:enoyl-CoA hydratase/carnithine racemase